MITRRLASVLLLSTALSAPAFAHAAALQSDSVTPQGAASTGSLASNVSADAPATATDQEQAEVSIPGVSELVVTGRRNIEQSASQVVSVLSTEQIARSGEGNIAGALTRVTGLSLVGSGYVYVRGLGDRYSLALLNGSPLPSPEPLRRVVPLDLFPTSIVSSALVQKSYSVNFPGEFGGGVINLTTRSAPQEGFLTLGASISGDSETTLGTGYSYYGSRTDWTGYDNGQRDIPAALSNFLSSGERISSGQVNTGAIASELVNARNSLVQRIGDVQANFSTNLAAGKSFELGDYTLGLIAGGGYSNRWVTRDATNQTSLQGDLSDLESNFRRVTTQNRLVTNGLLGLALQFGDNTVRWTNVYIHDTIKHTRLSLGNRNGTQVDYMEQDTAWYERQLIDTQVVGEFRPAENLSVDVRGSYAETKRESPFELALEYVRTNVAADPYGQYFVNRLNANAGDATISFSDLNERLWSGGLDATYRIFSELSVTAGYAYSDTRRTSSRRDFQFQAPSTFPRGVDMFRPDYLLQPSVISAYGVSLVETNEGNPAFLATLKNHAGYLKANGQITDDLNFDIGVRYESAQQQVSPIRVFNTPGASLAETDLDNDYVLPAATLTWDFHQDMQLRLNGSKTLARPQFRELIYQFYFDPDSNRMYRGNPLLVDSELTNAEARWEWYFGANQHLSAAAFYKKIENPIEAFVSGESLTTSFANAPQAELYGFEVEAEKRFDLSGWSNPFMASRRLVLRGNYTFSDSSLKVSEGDQVAVFASSSTRAADYFRDGAPMTGQSDHLVNLEIGLENPERLSQQTLLINYASERVTSRGLANSGQPDVFEKPGVRIDFVAREGVQVGNHEVELKLEARNLTGRKYEEFQQSGDNRVDINTYTLGRFVALSASIRF
ncbi:TonB-dependent receptor domain-containing protein [Phenylobacterium deserti]|uniref:TonB-dependent receptor n=1 Tax=Phenylobacterium deserti TaxID=1914756 RepID=A0A328AC07_9CAUL|nr:TonB-dependent receptor [Phenylobacterium deserti]RAK52180.1 TonB-dependent receptor [Phenylobacterium deserti]